MTGIRIAVLPRLRDRRTHVLVFASLIASVAVACSSSGSSGRQTSASNSESVATVNVAPGYAIAFTRSDPRGEGLYTIGPDGALTLLPQRSCCPHWSPDGTRLIIPVGGTPETSIISTAVINADGSGERVVSPVHPTMNLWPGAWSPDGARIALGGEDGDHPSLTGIYTTGSSGTGGLVRVTTRPGPITDGPMLYSPDGSRMLFFRPTLHDVNQGDLYVVDADGTDLRRVSPRGTNLSISLEITAFGWSPDGREITFADHSSEGGIWVVEADGTRPRRVARSVSPITAQWSPDGEWIVFEGKATGSGYELSLVHPDGTGPRTLVSSAEGGGFGPLWSPDGARLLFERESGGSASHLWLVNADGTGLVQLTRLPGGYSQYSWAPVSG